MNGRGLSTYLEQKGVAMAAAASGYEDGDAARETIAAECTAADSTGVRRIRIRDFQILSDSGPGFGGFGFGPSSPELLLGMLSSCLTHTYLIAAAQRRIALDAVKVRVEAENNDAHLLGLASSDPNVPFNIRATVHVESGAPAQDIASLHEYVEQNCPLTRLIREPQTIAILRS